MSPEVRGRMRSRTNWVSRGLFLFCFFFSSSPLLSLRGRRQRFNWSNGSHWAPTAELESGTHARFAPLRTRRSDVRRLCQGLGGAVSAAPRQPFFFFFFPIVLKGVGPVAGDVHVESQLKCGEKWETRGRGRDKHGQTP